VHDPDLVTVEAQLDALVHEPLGRTVEAAAVLQVAVDRHPHAAITGGVEARRRQRPQRRALLSEALGDREAAARVDARVADPVAPVDVLVVELAQAAETASRPEAGLEVTHGRLDRALLARRRRRAGAGVKRVVAAQMQEALIPDDLLPLAPGDDRAQVVVDALARHAAEKLEGAHVPLEKRLQRQIKLKCALWAPE